MNLFLEGLLVGVKWAGIFVGFYIALAVAAIPVFVGWLLWDKFKK